MAIRPADLQQAIMKTPDLTRDANVQQQAAAVQQGQSAETVKQHQRLAETVHQFDDSGAVLVRERDARAGQQGQRGDAQQPEGQAEMQAEDSAAARNTAKARLGGHVDLQA